jgi:hypothetical protein
LVATNVIFDLVTIVLRNKIAFDANHYSVNAKLALAQLTLTVRF